MEQRISLVTLGVEDLARATAFYERLGWTRAVREAPGIAFFQTGSFAFGLYPRDKLAEDAGLDALPPPPGAMALAFNTRTRDEVDRVLREVQEAGARLIKPAKDAFWGGYSGYFADPDGHLWEVAWNPGFAIAEDGAITLPD